MAKKRPHTAESGQPNFESAMEQLETIVRRLEQGGGPLEEALGDYATAIGLLKGCNGQLESAERRVEILSGVDAQGNPVARPMEESDISLEEKQQTRSSRRSASPDNKRDQSAEEPGLF